MSSRMRWAARAVGGGMLAGGVLLAALVPPAAADTPVKTGWWNTASGGGQAAPQPTTPAGELHVAVASNATLAYAAVAFQVASPSDSPTLTLQIDSSGETGTPAVDACPTANANWKSGGDQPASAAPAYDCSTTYYEGITSADGTTVSFYLDHNAMVGGVYSVAIVPAASDSIPQTGLSAPVDTTQPFSVNFKSPVLTGTSSGPSSASGGGVPSGAGAVPSGSGGGGAPGSAAVGPPAGGSQSTGGGSPGGAGPAPAVSLPAGSGGSASSATGLAAGSAPVVAPAGSGGTAAAPRSLAASTSATANRTRDVALGLLVVIGVLLVGTSNQGRVGRAPAPAVAGVERGLGRFAKPRTARPRPLT